MFTTVLLKEIQEAIYNYRFLLTMLLCLALIPLGLFVALKDYEQRLNDYHGTMRLYEQRAEGNVGWDFNAEGYRPPSAMSILSIGLEYYLPNKVETDRSGIFQIRNEKGITSLSFHLHSPFISHRRIRQYSNDWKEMEK